jgi:transposase-like protein/DDE family transposase
MNAASDPWWESELAGCAFADARLGQRLRKLIGRMGGTIGASFPLACQDWANTKAAYRFLSNDRVSEDQILAGHFHSTRDRFTAADGTILIVQDTTEFTYQRERPEAIGITYSVNSGKDKVGRFRMHTVCGLLMHASLALTTDGLPLGLSAVKFWSRQKFKGTAALKRKVNPTRVPIEHKESIRWLENMRQSTELLGEPARCVHVGDRESDIYELFYTARELGTHFLVRSCVDRLAGDGGHTIADEMDETRLKGVHRVEIRDGKNRIETALVELKYRRIRVLPPIGKQKRYPALTLAVIHAQERATPTDRPAIDWKLITDLPVSNRTAAIEKLRWYAQRWKIEVFHKILKSGCRAEEARLRTAERLVRLIAVFCILGWRVFWMTMMQRAAPDAARLVLTSEEIALLDRLVPDRKHAPPSAALSSYLTKVARLGGYLARTKDPPPGNTVMWRALSRLTDIKLGAMLADACHTDVGN